MGEDVSISSDVAIFTAEHDIKARHSVEKAGRS
jgi:hypothetical protein